MWIRTAYVEEYANGSGTLASVRHKYGIAEFVFQIWVGIYARFGKEPLLNPPKVTGDFRLNLVNVKGGFKLSFYGGLKMYDLGGLGIDRCQAI